MSANMPRSAGSARAATPSSSAAATSTGQRCRASHRTIGRSRSSRTESRPPALVRPDLGKAVSCTISENPRSRVRRCPVAAAPGHSSAAPRRSLRADRDQPPVVRRCCPTTGVGRWHEVGRPARAPAAAGSHRGRAAGGPWRPARGHDPGRRDASPQPGGAVRPRRRAVAVDDARLRKAADLVRDPRVLVHSVVTNRDGDEGEVKLRGTARQHLDETVQRRYAVAVTRRCPGRPRWGGSTCSASTSSR